ncbi:MAG: hypothetical protein HZA91_16365 [Verrucomicrobia bacterium]|nr:hypothetical protein [Verrucomicrobiota bacterium]
MEDEAAPLAERDDFFHEDVLLLFGGVFRWILVGHKAGTMAKAAAGVNTRGGLRCVALQSKFRGLLKAGGRSPSKARKFRKQKGKTMKKTVGMIAIVSLLAIGAPAYADCGSCDAHKAAAKSCPVGACASVLSKMDLSAEQKAQVAGLKAAFAKSENKAEGCAAFMKGIQSVLTPEQLAQCKEECAKLKAAGGCPASGGGCPSQKN